MLASILMESIFGTIPSHQISDLLNYLIVKFYSHLLAIKYMYAYMYFFPNNHYQIVHLITFPYYN